MWHIRLETFFAILIMMAHHYRSICKRFVSLVEGVGYVLVLELNCMVTQGSYHGYWNAVQVDKLEGAEELLWHLSSPAEDAALVAEANRNLFASARDFKAATDFSGQKHMVILRL